MPIEVVCDCGKRFQARDEYAGRRGLCPACKRQFDIPIPVDLFPASSIVSPTYSEPEDPRTVLPLFIYKMAQIPPDIEVAQRDQIGQKAAVYLERIVNGQAREGWEFYRVDPIGVQIPPGCLSVFFGATTQKMEFYVVTFRRPANDADRAQAESEMVATKKREEQRTKRLRRRPRDFEAERAEAREKTQKRSTGGA